MGAMRAERAIWPVDSDVGGQAGAQILQWAGWDGTVLVPMPTARLGPGARAEVTAAHQGNPCLAGVSPIFQGKLTGRR